MAFAMLIANVATYAYTMIAARVLGPADYGAFASLMATIIVLMVVHLGLQTTAARRVAANPQQVGPIERSVLLVSLYAATALGLSILLGSPALERLLRLDDLTTAALVATTAFPLTLMGGQLGIFQGERRWFHVGALYLAIGVPRLVFGTVSILIQPSTLAAMVGVTAAAFIPAVYASLALRRSVRSASSVGGQGSRGIAVEAMRASSALMAFLVLSNADVVIARQILDDHRAGLYAGGLILTKAVLFLPQFVVVVAFPSMSTESQRRRALLLGLGLVGGLGLSVSAGTAVLSRFALIFVGGPQYGAVRESLWQFAVVGTLWALLQLLIYATLARQQRWAGQLPWLGLLMMVALSTQANSVQGLLTVVLATETVLCGVLLVIALRPAATAVPEPQPVG